MKILLGVCFMLTHRVALSARSIKERAASLRMKEGGHGVFPGNIETNYR